jgi:hypothetical protein
MGMEFDLDARERLLEGYDRRRCYVAGLGDQDPPQSRQTVELAQVIVGEPLPGHEQRLEVP